MATQAQDEIEMTIYQAAQIAEEFPRREKARLRVKQGDRGAIIVSPVGYAGKVEPIRIAVDGTTTAAV